MSAHELASPRVSGDSPALFLMETSGQPLRRIRLRVSQTDVSAIFLTRSPAYLASLPFPELSLPLLSFPPGRHIEDTPGSRDPIQG